MSPCCPSSDARGLSEALAGFDGRHTSALEDAAAELTGDPATVTELLRIARRGGNDEIGATWLLKRLVEEGAPVSRTKRLVDLLPRLETDMGRLHVLQTLPLVRLTGTALAPLHDSLVELLESDHKFVRAWTFQGFAILAQANAAYRDEALRRLMSARESEPASVRARIRHAMKELEDE